MTVSYYLYFPLCISGYLLLLSILLYQKWVCKDWLRSMTICTIIYKPDSQFSTDWIMVYTRIKLNSIHSICWFSPHVISRVACCCDTTLYSPSKNCWAPTKLIQFLLRWRATFPCMQIWEILYSATSQVLIYYFNKKALACSACIGNHLLTRVSHYKYHGIVFTSNLSKSRHIEKTEMDQDVVQKLISFVIPGHSYRFFNSLVRHHAKYACECSLGSSSF